jgi:hypothetical protein
MYFSSFLEVLFKEKNVEIVKNIFRGPGPLNTNCLQLRIKSRNSLG